MNLQKETARKSWSGSGDKATDEIWLELKEREGESTFLGYENFSAKSKVKSIVVDGKEVEELDIGAKAEVITSSSPFYAESGGQLGDTGEFTWKSGKAIVEDTKKYENLIVHIVKITQGVLKKNDEVNLYIDIDRRNALKIHHSATHLLHEALRQHLGDHISQKGSLVSPDKLRFDISHNKPISNSDINIIEKEINKKIRENFEIETTIMDIENARKIGALALFGEKYGDQVRVVKMGKNNDNHYSVELCGGTHVNRSGDIGVLKILSESALGSGVRRIEAVAGSAALTEYQEENNIINELSLELKTSKENLKERINSLILDKKYMEKKLVDLNKKINTSNISNKESENKVINGIKVISKVLNTLPPRELKGLVDEFKKELVSGIVIIISTLDDKASLVIGVTKDVSDKFNAIEFTKAGVEVLGGKGGGGRPDMAQGGGPNYKKAGEAIDTILSLIKTK
jgi:alanyl-tRNA synthetase